VLINWSTSAKFVGGVEISDLSETPTTTRSITDASGQYYVKAS
jgi:hypothetical protein